MRSGVERARVGDVGADGARGVTAVSRGSSGGLLGPSPETSVGTRGSVWVASPLGRSAAVLEEVEGGMDTEDEDADGGPVRVYLGRSDGVPSHGAGGDWRSSGDGGVR